MIYNVVGQEFIYEGVTYRVGAEVVGTAESDYRGLNGFILEIRTGDDKETENETPDIHCYFDPPCLPSDIEELEKRFSALYGTEKKLEDITLDYVIMAPEEILVLQSPRKTIEIYVLEEDWAANDDYGHSVAVYADYYEAKAKLNANLEEEMKNGCLTDWMQKDNYQFDTDEDSYEGWIDGEHSSSHYRVSIIKLPLQLPNSVYGTLGREYIDLCRVEDFIEQIESWDNVGMLTDEQYQELISDKTIPDRIHKALGMNDGYYGSYWESVSEVAHTVVNAYIAQNTHIGAESSEKKNEEV